MPTELKSLFAAIVRDDRARVKALLRQNQNLATQSNGEAWLEKTTAHWTYPGDTALHLAAAGYQMEIAKLLLDAGADPNFARNHRHTTPLHCAAMGYVVGPCWNPQRQVAMIRLLLQAGSNIDAQDKNGATPLHRAVRTRCAAAVKCLLNAGADFRIKNKPGSTPFHLAVQNTGRGGSGAETAKAAQREIIQAFLAHGVSPAIKDERGRSVLDWARSDWIRELLG